MGAEVGGTNKAKSDPNVVPLCDILLVLLIIFMVITPAMQKGIDVKLPESGGEEQAPQSSSYVLTLEKGNVIKLNQETVDPTLLEERLRQIFQTRQDKTIFIRAEDDTPYREVLKIIDIAKGAGIEVLGVIPEHYSTVSEQPEM